MKVIKVLLIAPIPKEYGGSYTTGVCKVVSELMHHSPIGIQYYLSSSNLKDSNANKLCTYVNQYRGYRILFFDVLSDLILHPLRTFKEFYVYWHKCHVNPFRYEFYKVNIKRHISEIEPDLIHVHTTEVPAVYFANTKHIPVLNTFHGIFYRGEKCQKQHGDFLKFCANHCDYFTGLTRECEFYMKKLLNISDDKITIIPNGVNTKVYFYNETQRNIIRKQMGVSDNIILFITVASVQERKGQLCFIKVLEKLNVDWQYWIVGIGPDLEIIEKYILEHNLSSRVKCLGRKNSEDLYKYYSAADIYAHPSTMEGQALCEMEAYSTGIRVVANIDIKDTITTNVSDDNIYFLLKMDDVDYSVLIKWLTKKTENRSSRSDINWNVVSNRYSKLYEKILKNSMV